MLAAAMFPVAGPPVVRSCEIRHAGGAVATGAQRPDSSTGNRDASFLLVLVGLIDSHHDATTIADAQAACTAGLGAHPSGRTCLDALDGPCRAAGAATSIDAADLEAIIAVPTALDPLDVMRFGVQHGYGGSHGGNNAFLEDQ